MEENVQPSSASPCDTPANPPVQPSAPPKPPQVTFLGNTNDVLAVVAATVAAITGLCCVSWGSIVYVLPLAAVALGGVALLNAKASVDPNRTRLWGWISIGTGGVVLVVVVLVAACFVLFYGLMILSVISSSPSSPYLTPTPRFR